jgi:hypothetical protein
MVAPRIITLNKKQVCYKCGTEITYSTKFDCYYCCKCHIWLEPKCDDLFCLFCRKRPTRPQAEKHKVQSKDKKKTKSRKRKAIEWKI